MGKISVTAGRNECRFIILSVLIIIIISILFMFGCSSQDALDELYITNGYFENLELGGADLLIPAYGELYLTAFEDMELTTANDWYIIDGPSTTGEIKGFVDNGASRLTYIDVTKERICLLNTALTLSVDAADVPCIIRALIYKNGAADPASLVGDQFVVGDAVEALPIVCLIELLNNNDYIEIYLSSNVNNTTVRVYTMTLIATTVD